MVLKIGLPSDPSDRPFYYWNVSLVPHCWLPALTHFYFSQIEWMTYFIKVSFMKKKTFCYPARLVTRAQWGGVFVWSDKRGAARIIYSRRAPAVRSSELVHSRVHLSFNLNNVYLIVIGFRGAFSLVQETRCESEGPRFVGAHKRSRCVRVNFRKREKFLTWDVKGKGIF